MLLSVPSIAYFAPVDSKGHLQAAKSMTVSAHIWICTPHYSTMRSVRRLATAESTSECQHYNLQVLRESNTDAVLDELVATLASK